MSIKTGLHRLAQVIKAIGALFAGLAVIGGVVTAVRGSGFSDGAVFILGGAVTYAIFWAVAWVLDGFAKE